jgi:hypothetical protein
MDLGLLFRKRLNASQSFLKILTQRTYLAKGSEGFLPILNVPLDESPAEILKSYLLALIASKIICTPFEIAELVCQTKHRKFNALQTVLILCLRTKGKRKLLFSGLGIDFAALIPNIIIENIIFDSLSVLSLSRLLASLMSKLASVIVSYPLEVLRTRSTLADINDNIFSISGLPVTLKSSLGDIWREPHAGLPLTWLKVFLYIVSKEIIYNQLKYIGLKRVKREISR